MILLGKIDEFFAKVSFYESCINSGSIEPISESMNDIIGSAKDRKKIFGIRWKDGD